MEPAETHPQLGEHTVMKTSKFMLGVRTRMVDFGRSRIALACAIALLCLAAGQGALFGLLEAQYLAHGPATARLATAKLAIVKLAFPHATLPAELPLVLLAALAVAFALIPVVLTVIGAATIPKRNEEHAKGLAGAASGVAQEFAALWAVGGIVSSAYIVVISLTAKAVSPSTPRPDLLYGTVILLVVVALSLSPYAAVVVALRVVAVRRLVVLLGGLSFVSIPFLATRFRALSHWLAWLSPRTYEDYLMSGAHAWIGISGLLATTLAVLMVAVYFDPGRNRLLSHALRARVKAHSSPVTPSELQANSG